MRMAAWILAVLAVLAVPMVLAEPSAASISVGTEQNYTNVTTTAGQVDANAGYVVEVNASSVTNTTYWAGVYGTVSIQKMLGAGTNVFYSWTGTPQWIYFVHGTVNWTASYLSSSVTDANIVSMGVWASTPTIETLDNTYPDSGATGACGTLTLAAGETERRVTLGGTWTNCLAAYDNANGFEGTDDTLVIVSNVASGTAFDGSTTVDYEALLPAGSATAYVVYVE